MDEPLTWYAAEGVRARRIYLRRDADLEDRGRWPDYHCWLVKKLDQMHAVFAPRVAELAAVTEAEV